MTNVVVNTTLASNVTSLAAVQPPEGVRFYLVFHRSRASTTATRARLLLLRRVPRAHRLCALLALVRPHLLPHGASWANASGSSTT